jgi:hypothetical protein
MGQLCPPCQEPWPALPLSQAGLASGYRWREQEAWNRAWRLIGQGLPAYHKGVSVWVWRAGIPQQGSSRMQHSLVPGSPGTVLYSLCCLRLRWLWGQCSGGRPSCPHRLGDPSHSTSPFFVMGVFKIGSHELFAPASFEILLISASWATGTRLKMFLFLTFIKVLYSPESLWLWEANSVHWPCFLNARYCIYFAFGEPGTQR